MTDPLIVTARFDPASAATFQRLRDRYFPPSVNIVPAHLTLFHHLPGTDHEAVLAALDAERPETGVVPFTTGRLRFLGRGTAVEIVADGLSAVRAAIAARWAGVLTAQDRQSFRPHVTIVNKLSSAPAREVQRRLELEGIDVRGEIEGLDLWHYRGGPWEAAGGVRWAGADVPRFSSAAPASST